MKRSRQHVLNVRMRRDEVQLVRKLAAELGLSASATVRLLVREAHRGKIGALNE